VHEGGQRISENELLGGFGRLHREKAIPKEAARHAAKTAASTQLRNLSMTGQLSLTSFVIGACAAWRAAHLIAFEDGPADLIFKMRERLGRGFTGRFMDCFECVSIWAAAPALLINSPWYGRLLAWFAISGAACLLERMSVRNHLPSLEDIGGTKDVVLWRKENGIEKSDRAARQ